MSSIFGGGGSTVNTVQKSDPWWGTQPHLLDINSLARQQYDQNRQGYNYVANQSPFTAQAQQLIAQRALDPNSLIGQSQSMLGNTISGKYLSPDSNPYLQSSVQDALGLAGSAFAKQYGGAAGRNLDNSGYQEALARGLGATATNAYANAYNTERQNQLNATQLAPSMDYANLQALGGVGAQQEALSRAQYEAPNEALQRYLGIVSGQPGGTTTGQSPYFTNPFANALGLGIGGTALYNGLGGASLFGSGAGAGAALTADPYAYYSGGAGLDAVLAGFAP